ncbi:MAG: ABC transporter ATP-binding protein [Candidatus Competibacteraceae bacterium]|jgi:peptide/nickel transport system ATP-binding protein|nr:ABC transporter ATP-binding protein [Candidatus Competibacteraceae bacterium]
MNNSTPVLDVANLKISFRTDEGLITPVDGVDFQVWEGRTLGIVGESGSGKSVSTRAVTKLLPKNAIIDPESRITVRTKAGTMLETVPLKPNGKAMRSIRGGEIAMIFQEPMASFSPVYTIGNQIAEAVRLHRSAAQSPLAVTATVGEQITEGIRAHQPLSKKQAKEIAVEMLDKVGISNAGLRVDQFPHELSGGMRQRAMIAVALSTHPKILIADEPTTALDVTIQAQILDLMRALQQDLGMAIIFITHDMGVIAQVADEVAVMYLGRIVERGPAADIINDPKHPYTAGLLAAIPRLDKLERRLTPVGGDIPSPMERPQGCAFHPRCPRFIPGTCDASPPPEVKTGDNRFVRCFLHV